MQFALILLISSVFLTVKCHLPGGKGGYPLDGTYPNMRATGLPTGSLYSLHRHRIHGYRRLGPIAYSRGSTFGYDGRSTFGYGRGSTFGYGGRSAISGRRHDYGYGRRSYGYGYGRRSYGYGRRSPSTSIYDYRSTYMGGPYVSQSDRGTRMNGLDRSPRRSIYYNNGRSPYVAYARRYYYRPRSDFTGRRSLRYTTRRRGIERYRYRSEERPRIGSFRELSRTVPETHMRRSRSSQSSSRMNFDSRTESRVMDRGRRNSEFGRRLSVGRFRVLDGNRQFLGGERHVLDGRRRVLDGRQQSNVRGRGSSVSMRGLDTTIGQFIPDGGRVYTIGESRVIRSNRIPLTTERIEGQSISAGRIGTDSGHSLMSDQSRLMNRDSQPFDRDTGPTSELGLSFDTQRLGVSDVSRTKNVRPRSSSISNAGSRTSNDLAGSSINDRHSTEMGGTGQSVKLRQLDASYGAGIGRSTVSERISSVKGREFFDAGSRLFDSVSGSTADGSRSIIDQRLSFGGRGSFDKGNTLTGNRDVDVDGINNPMENVRHIMANLDGSLSSNGENKNSVGGGQSTADSNLSLNSNIQYVDGTSRSVDVGSRTLAERTSFNKGSRTMGNGDTSLNDRSNSMEIRRHSLTDGGAMNKDNIGIQHRNTDNGAQGYFNQGNSQNNAVRGLLTKSDDN